MDEQINMVENVKVLAILYAITPSTTILVVEPLMYLADLGKIEFRLRLENFDTRLSDLEWADLVIFCRNTEPAYYILERLLVLGKRYIYELDDNFFELPLDTPEGRYHRNINRITMLEEYIKHASLVRVYSLPLEDHVRQYTQNVTYVRAPVNLEYIPHRPPLRDPHKVKILFSTSRTASDKLSQIFLKDLIKVLNEYEENVEVHFWGYMPHELKGLHSVKFHRFMANYPKYVRVIYDTGYDIGLAPLKNDLFHNSKTNNKFREYGACWIAGVYSNTEVYANCVENGKTGLLVSNEKGAWYQAIKQLINDPVLRRSIQEEAHTFVEKEYAISTFALSLLSDINRVLAVPVDFAESKKYPNKNTVAVNGRGEIVKKLIRSVSLLLSSVRKVFGSIQNYGMEITVRLIFEQLGRYARYFQLSKKINRRQKR